MQFPFSAQHQIPGLKPAAEKPAGPRSAINLPLRKRDMQRLTSGKYSTDAPNRYSRKAHQKALRKIQEAEAKKLRAMSPKQQQRYRHNQWLDSLRPIVKAMGNSLEEPFCSTTGSSWFFRVAS